MGKADQQAGKSGKMWDEIAENGVNRRFYYDCLYLFTWLQHFSGHVIYHSPTAFLVVRNMRTL